MNRHCEVCDKGFVNSKQLSNHRRTHAPNIQCPDCTYSAKYPTNLLRHRSAVHGNYPEIKCPDCFFCTKYASNLSKHRRIVHEVQQISLDENPGLTHASTKSTGATNEHVELDKMAKTPEHEHVFNQGNSSHNLCAS